MEQCSPFNWVFYNEDEGMMIGEVRQCILQSRMEVEATALAAQQEIMKKEEELIHLKDVLTLTIKERDEAYSKLQNLMLEKLLLQQQLQHQKEALPFSNTNAITNNCFSSSSSESEETCSIISSSPRGYPTTSPALQPPTLVANPTSAASPLPVPPQITAALATSRHRLPEKGRLLKAVMEAGPLLQTLLLAGPLPQWQHPPPQLDSIEIPQVTITTSNSNSPRKRGIHNLDCLTISSPKYQRVI